MKDMIRGNQEVNSSEIGNRSKEMPRGALTKEIIIAKVLKLKYDLYSEKYLKFSDNEKASANEMLNSVLDILDEYRY